MEAAKSWNVNQEDAVQLFEHDNSRIWKENKQWLIQQR